MPLYQSPPYFTKSPPALRAPWTARSFRVRGQTRWQKRTKTPNGKLVKWPSREASWLPGGGLGLGRTARLARRIVWARARLWMEYWRLRALLEGALKERHGTPCLPSKKTECPLSTGTTHRTPLPPSTPPPRSVPHPASKSKKERRHEPYLSFRLL